MSCRLLPPGWPGWDPGGEYNSRLLLVPSFSYVLQWHCLTSFCSFSLHLHPEIVTPPPTWPPKLAPPPGPKLGVMVNLGCSETANAPRQCVQNRLPPENSLISVSPLHPTIIEEPYSRLKARATWGFRLQSAGPASLRQAAAAVSTGSSGASRRRGLRG